MTRVERRTADSDEFAVNDRGMVFGTYEQGRQLLGVPAPPKRGHVAADQGMIRLFCGMIEDANRSYWDDQFAQQAWRGIPSPPAMLFTWTLPLPWNPTSGTREGPLCTRVPLPGSQLINARQGAEFFQPVYVGDELSMVETLTALSEEKVTRLGTGHFITTEASFERDGGDVVATLTNTLFRFTPADS